MALQDSIAERLFYTNRKRYTDQEGNVAYLESKGLKRPFAMPVAQRVIAAVIVVAAIFIGYTIVDRVVLNTYREAAAFQTAIETNLARPASIDTIPAIATLMPLENDAIVASLGESGAKVYDMTSLNDSYDLMLCKVPDDMTAEQVAALYAKGIGTLDAPQATQLLNGSWTLGVDRANGTMVVRYADFKTGDPQIAVQNAIAKEGFDAASITESGTDDSGNTYSMGSIETEAGLCEWAGGLYENAAFAPQAKTVTIPALNGMTVLWIPDGTAAIAEEAFEGISAQAVMIPDGCAEIGSRAFAGCPNLIYVYMPANVTSVAADAFAGCPGLILDRAE